MDSGELKWPAIQTGLVKEAPQPGSGQHHRPPLSASDGLARYQCGSLFWYHRGRRGFIGLLLTRLQLRLSVDCSRLGRSLSKPRTLSYV
jgi:hypothetical protein